MIQDMKTKIIAIGLAVMALTSCVGRSGWSIEGTLNGSEEGSRLALEGYNAGRWYVLDSIDVKASGKFAYKSDAPFQSVEILRLTLPGKGSVCFPVDSVDAITLEADAARFGTGHKLGGTPLAQTFSAIDSVSVSTPDMSELQRKLAEFITADTTGIVAYYVVGKSIGNSPIFNPEDNFGNRVYGAAAQVYAHYRPLDPRGTVLRQAYFAGRQALGKLTTEANTQVIDVAETGIIEIERYDNKGERQSLQELVSKGNVVLLSFTDYGIEASPAYNAILNDLYELYHAKGLEIYQIAFDADEVEWKASAINLPWITVWNSPADGINVLSAYNVGVLPLTYIVDRKGDLGARIIDPTELPKKLAAYF